MEFPVKILTHPGGPTRHITFSFLVGLADIVGLKPHKAVTAVVSPGIVVLCLPEYAEVFARILRDFPSTFVQQEPPGQGDKGGKV